jgi:hypothetical protein
VEAATARAGASVVCFFWQACIANPKETMVMKRADDMERSDGSAKLESRLFDATPLITFRL